MLLNLTKFNAESLKSRILRQVIPNTRPRKPKLVYKPFFFQVRTVFPEQAAHSVQPLLFQYYTARVCCII